MFELVEFDRDHALQMAVQPAQLTEVNREALATPFGFARTAMVDGVPIACAGLVKVWHGRALAWALLSSDCGPYMLRLARAMRQALDLQPYRRIEMSVAAGFWPGCRLANLLGFTLDAPEPLRAYLPDGRDAWLFSRVKA